MQMPNFDGEPDDATATDYAKPAISLEENICS
jgi:hypothetical protein